jgi:hypothetical protein
MSFVYFLSFSSVFSVLTFFGELKFKRFLTNFPFLLTQKSRAIFIALFAFCYYLTLLPPFKALELYASV